MTDQVRARHPWALATLGAVIAAGLGLMMPAAVRAATFQEALAAAYNTNPLILSARARLRQVDETVPQALSNWRPRVTIPATTVGRENFTTRTTVGSETSTVRSSQALSVDPTVTQPLYRGGRTVAATSSAENGVLAERARLVATEQQVLLSAATSYVDVLRDEATVELNIANERRLLRQLERAQDGYRVGELSNTDVAQAEARRAQAIAARIASEGQLATSRAIYRRLVGTSPAALTNPERPGNLPPSREDAEAQAAKNNPNVIAAQYAETGARDDVRVVGGEFLPEVNLTADISRIDSSLTSRSGGLRTDTRSIIADATMPLYQAGKVASRHRAAKQTVDQRHAEVEDARRAAVESSVRAFEQYKAAQALFESFTEAIPAAEIALEGVEQEAVLGFRSTLDVLDAEHELLIAKVNQIQATRDEFVATFQLLAAMGRFTARELGLAVELYDPEANYKIVRDKW